MSIKWVLAIVVCLALFAYQRQNGRKSQSFEETIDLNIEAPVPAADVIYTSTPPMDQQNDSNGSSSDEPQTLTAPADILTNVEIPFVDSSETSFDEFFLEEESELQLEPPVDNPTISQLPPQHNRIPQENQIPQERMREPAIEVKYPIELPQGVLTKVVRHIEYGKSLARRGAVFGAKNEFHNALRLIAQSIDYQYETKQFSESLFLALEAINEADDFYFAQSRNNGKVDVASIGARHTSRILDRHELRSMNSMDALQAYYNFVQDQLVRCGGQTVVASEALYCLGKLFLVGGKMTAEGSPLDNAKSIVHHRAALACDSRNFKSANELAVLLFQSGRLEQAKKMLVHSLKVKQVPAAWENLAMVHQELGEHQLAQLATAEHKRMLHSTPTTNQIQWISPEQFADDSNREPAELRMANAASSQTQQPPKKESKIKNVFNKLF